MRRVACVVAVCAAAVSVAVLAARLPASYRPPAGDELGQRVAQRAWTYDLALRATAASLRGQQPRARRLLDALGAWQRPDGSWPSSVHVDGYDPDPLTRSGVVAWGALAAAQYRRSFCSARYDRMMLAASDWLLSMRVTSGPARGLVRGGPDVAWVSTEHNVEARAVLAAAADTAGGVGRAGCTRARTGRPARARSREVAYRSAVRALDRQISSRLLVQDDHGAWFRQGDADDEVACDAQTLGALWLVGQDRGPLARIVLERWQRDLWRVGAHGLQGCRPYGNGPDVVWLEGTLQGRLAFARSGMSTSVFHGALVGWRQASPSAGWLLAADRSGGDFHAWPAAAPRAWLTLARRDFDLLG